MKRNSLPLWIAYVLLGACGCIVVPDGGDNGGDGDGNGDGGTTTPLNQASAVVKIVQTVGGQNAAVTAVITDGRGIPVTLAGRQAIWVNDQELSGSFGQYTRTVPAAAAYTLTVREPTRGVQDTQIAAPAEFSVTSPAAGGVASLAGFAVTWSAPEPDVETKVVLTQSRDGRNAARTFGPLADEGSLQLTLADLAEFVQGVELRIKVVKTRTVEGVNGFAGGNLTVELSTSVAVNPGP